MTTERFTLPSSPPPPTLRLVVDPGGGAAAAAAKVGSRGAARRGAAWRPHFGCARAGIGGESPEPGLRDGDGHIVLAERSSGQAIGRAGRSPPNPSPSALSPMSTDRDDYLVSDHTRGRWQWPGTGIAHYWGQEKTSERGSLVHSLRPSPTPSSPPPSSGDRVKVHHVICRLWWLAQGTGNASWWAGCPPLCDGRRRCGGLRRHSSKGRVIRGEG